MADASRILLAPVLAAALLAACDSAPSGGSGAAGAASGQEVEVMANGVSLEETARLRRRAQTALATLLPDIASTRFANLRNGSAGAVCGEVEIVPGAPLHPFLVTPAGVGMLSASPTVRMDDPEDAFPDLYMQYCASVEELRRLGDSMNGMAPPRVPPPEPVPALPPEAGDDPVEGEGSSDAREPARRSDDESFFNSVVRAPRSAAPRR